MQARGVNAGWQPLCCFEDTTRHSLCEQQPAIWITVYKLQDSHNMASDVYQDVQTQQQVVVTNLVQTVDL